MDPHGIYDYRDLAKVKNIYRDRSVVKIKEGLRIYSSKKVVLSEQEKQDYEKRIQKQVEKYERDLKCGGIDCNGNFTRLHDRNEIYN